MNIQLIQGSFPAADAMELIAQMIQIKIRYHEGKISSQSNEEDIKAREAKIKHLQNELHDLRKAFNSTGTNVQVDGVIKIE